MLQSKGDPDNGDAQQNPEKKVREGNPQTCEYQPYEVEQEGNPWNGGMVGLNGFSEWRQGGNADFEALKPPWDTDDGQTEDQSAPDITQARHQSAKNDPDYVSNDAHY